MPRFPIQSRGKKFNAADYDSGNQRRPQNVKENYKGWKWRESKMERDARLRREIEEDKRAKETPLILGQSPSAAQNVKEKILMEDDNREVSAELKRLNLRFPGLKALCSDEGVAEKDQRAANEAAEKDQGPVNEAAEKEQGPVNEVANGGSQGSGRSINEFDLIELPMAVRKKKTKSGGAPMTRTPTKDVTTKKLTEQSDNFQSGSLYKSESITCAYVGLGDISDIKRLRVATPVLVAYQLLHKNVFTKKRASKHAFGILRDLTDENKAVEFGKSQDELVAKYVTDDTMSSHSRDYLLAGVLYHLANTLEDLSEVCKTDDAVVATFEKNMGCTIVPFDRNSILLPVLGPRSEFEEHHMERYSRVFAILKHLQNKLSGSIKAYFNTEIYASVKVSQTSVPLWMRPSLQAQGISKPGTSSVVPRFLPKKFTIEIQRGAITKIEADLAKHEASYVRFNSMALPEGRVDALHDPRLYENGSEWRDVVRRQLDMFKLRVDICSIVMSSVLEQGVIVYDAVTRSKARIWNEVLCALRKDAGDVIFSVQLRALDDTEIEETEYPYEYQGVTMSLSSTMIIINDELVASDSVVQSKKPDDPFSDQPQPIAHHDADEAAARQAKEFMGNRPIVNKSTAISPTTLFSPEQHEESLKYHGGFDVSTADGLLAWQRSVLSHLVANEDFPSSRAPMKGVSKAVRLEVQSLDEDIASAAVEIEGQSTDTHESFRLQEAITGGCIRKKARDKVTLTSIPGCKIEFLESQLTGAVFMLMKTLGHIPVPVDAPDDVKEAASTLIDLATGGGMLVDGMGLGKTYTAILFLVYYVLYATKDQKIPPACCGDKPAKPQDRVRWISATAMRDAPSKLEYWPHGYEYIWDQSDPRASNVVVLSSPETWAGRTIDEEYIYNESSGKEELVYSSSCQGLFGVAILDEGHRFRSMHTQMFHALQCLKTEFHWFLTGTPVINSINDVVGPMSILWVHVKKVLEANVEHATWINANMRTGGYGVFTTISNMDKLDIRRLIAMDPLRALALFSADLPTISANFKMVDEMFVIRRTLASTLRKNDDETISLRTMMPSYIVQTKVLQYRPDEALEAQHGHLLHDREYNLAIKEWRGASKDGHGKSFPRIGAPLRRMTLLSTSTHLERLENTLRKAGLTGHVMDMRGLRERGLNAFDLVGLVRREGDPEDLQTGLQHLKFLSYGSPKLRYVLNEVLTYVLPGTTEDMGEKLLLVEDVPLAAEFWQMVLSLTYVDVAIMHSGLDEDERIDLSRRFNDKNDSLRILIIMYAVNAAGVNLDGACSRVIVLTPAINYAVEAQGFSRLLRVSQTRNVLVVRLVVDNSHDGSRETRQADKAIPDLATRSWSVATKELLVQYLNQQQVDVRNMHESEVGQQILAGRLVLPMQAATVLAGENESRRVQPNRTKKKPSRLIDEIGQGQDTLVDGEESDEDDTQSQYEDDGEYGDGSALTTDEMKKAFRQQALEFQESFNQEEYNMRLLLSIPVNKVFTVTDLNNPAILERALRILFCRRIGMSSPTARLGPHITYSLVPTELREKMKKMVEGTPSVGILKMKWRTLGTTGMPGEKNKQAPTGTPDEPDDSIKPAKKAKISQGSLGSGNRNVRRDEE
ncbi:hypothetical protein V500_02085 [Pseudogymnoascus sp. VKM F-4518 (FW-2643)]|nr:hypothetical protein V500_02085 [Pseudogymnoascus sp. VKM F-4518 (FW-2643)]